MSNSSIRHNPSQGVEIQVRGIVQGVGFRPFIYNLANRYGIVGSVSNSGDGVTITAIADEEVLGRFVDDIRDQAPPLARISAITTHPLDFLPESDRFEILVSHSSGPATTAIPPDVAICEDCLRELLDPDDFRFRYPFINCTNCGPRFTIVETVPYDRPKTSMRVFPMCDRCSEEYHDPGNRRFHAQPNACPACGPTVSFHSRTGECIEEPDPLNAAVRALSQGKVLGLRGLGGFHLVIDGTSEQAVARLRQRKNRPDKPLAVMVADIETARSFCHLSTIEEELLRSPIHPIVLLTKREKTALAPNLAPGIRELGLMLPYTPLHHLLFSTGNCPPALVMTSGNISGQPICTSNEDGIEKLGHIADCFLLHNREIVTRVDDSVVKVVNSRPRILRRARGYCPTPVEIAHSLPPSLGCGAGLKNTFCLGRDSNLYPSQHIGDLDNLEVFEFYRESIDHMKKLLQLEPECVVCDLHPDYLSTRFAEDTGLPLYRVQHHHAHATAVMAEHGLDGELLALILDGTGLGTDNTIWGGELLHCSLVDFRRLGHLSQLPLPGGDLAAREPWRMAISALFTSFGRDALRRDELPRTMKDLDRASVDLVASMLTNSFNSPLSSSCGRLFDAAAGLLGLRRTISFEGQAAMELEAIARQAATPEWTKTFLPHSHTDLSRILQNNGEKWEIRSDEFVTMLLDGIRRGESAQQLALQFHAMLVYGLTELVIKAHKATGLDRVVLAGGCFQNGLLLTAVIENLEAAGFSIFTGEKLPVNDGAISTGQTITGGLRHVSRNSHEGDQYQR